MSSTGDFSLAPEEWIYEPVLVDRWGFLAKTILVLERLKAHPSDNYMDIATEDEPITLNELPSVSIPASADSHPSQVTPQLVEKTLADAMATEVRVSASASPAVHPYLATPDAMTANPQIRTADSQPHTGSNTHSTQSSSGPKAANFSSSIEKPPQLTPQSQEQSLQLVSRAASLEVDQLLSVLVKEVEQHVNGQQLSHSIAALPAEQHTQQQKALAAAPASAEPSTDSGSTAAISADVYTPHDAQSAAESKPDDMAAVVSTATDSAVDGAAVKQLNRQPLIAVADDPKAQALIVQSGAAMTALPHDDNIHDSSAAIADSAVRADSAVKKDSAVNADSTTNKASDIDENSNLIADSADVDGSAAANDSTPTSQSMMQGRAAMTALPDDDDVSEDATVAESAPAIVSSMLTAADVTSTPQDTWQAKAVMTALPDNDDINEDTADAESATAVDSSILTAAVSAPQTTLHAKAVMMPLPDNEDVDEDVNEDIAHAKPAVAAAVTNSDATGISVKPDASSDTANMEGTAAAGYRDLNDAAVTDARESVLPVISTSSTQQSDAAAVHDTSEVSTSSTQQLHIAADNDTLDSGLSMISTRSTQQLDTAVVDDTLQTLLSEASISSTGQNLPPQQPQTEHEVKQPQTRGGADDLAVAGDAPSEAGVKADKVVQPITALQDSARPWPEDEVLNELVSEASLEPHQEQANEPLSPAKPVSAFADRTVQEQVDGPKPEDEVLNGLSGATSHEAAVESPISAEPNQQTMPSLHKQATAQDSTIAQATEELVDITKPNDTAADAHHVVSEQGPTWREQAQQSIASAAVTSEVDRVVEELVIAMSIGPATDLYTKEQPQLQQQETDASVGAEVNGVLEELIVAMSIGGTFEHVLAAEPAMQENVHLNTEPSPLATDTAQQAQHATHDDAASLPASRQLEDAEEAMQAEVISSDTVPQKSAESGAALATMAASASADVDQVLDGLTSTAVTEQQPAAAGTDTEETLSASLPQDANQQQARVTADVDEAVAQVISSVEQPEAIVPSGSAESAGREAEEDWQPATANDVATAEQQQFRVTGDVDQTLTDLTSSLEIPAAESDFTEVQAANVARDSSQHTTPDAYGAVGADSSNPQDVAMLETHSGAEGNEQQGTLPDAAAAVNTDTGSEQPTIDEANAEQPQIDNLQRNPEHLSGDIDQLLADLMPAMPDQASAAKSQQQLSAAEHSSSAVEGLASQPAAETLPTDGMTNEGARVQQALLPAESADHATAAESTEVMSVPAAETVAAAADVQSLEAGLDVPLDRDYDECLKVVMSELTAEALGQEQSSASFEVATAVPAVPALPADESAAFKAEGDSDTYEGEQFESDTSPDVRHSAVLIGVAASAAAVGMAASMAAASATAQHMPARPASPVASQLASLNMAAPVPMSNATPAAMLATNAEPSQGTVDKDDDRGYDNGPFDTDLQESISDDVDQSVSVPAVSPAAPGPAANTAADDDVNQDYDSDIFDAEPQEDFNHANDQPASVPAAVSAPAAESVTAATAGEGCDSDTFDAEQPASSDYAAQELADLPHQVEQDDSSSLSGASADADDADRGNDSRADFANDAYDNDAFYDDEEVQDESQPADCAAQEHVTAAEQESSTAQKSEAEDLMAMSIQPREPAVQDSGDWGMPAQASSAQDSSTQASDAQSSAFKVQTPGPAEHAVPMPPPAPSAPDGRPARPSRAFMRRTSSLMKPKTVGQGTVEASRPPQPPPAAPPQHRSRPHAPLVHQVSVSGKGSVGQPARIEAFWPSRPPAQEPSRPPHPRPAPAPRRQKLSKQQLSKGSPKTEGYSSATVRLSEEGSDVIGLHELGRPLNHKSRGSPSGVDVAGRELTKHLEYDILQCMAKNRPEHLAWLVVKAREMGVRSSNPAVAAAGAICKLKRRQAVSKPPPLLTQELADMRASLMAVDAILPSHGIMPGQIHASPVFDNASRALQRLSLDNDATTAIAGGDVDAMDQVLVMAVKLNNPVVAGRLQDAIMHKEELAGSASGRSVPWSPRASVKGSPRSQEGLVRLRDLASPVRPRSVHGSRRPSPARWEGSRGGSKRALMTDDVVQRLEEHDDEQAELHSLWVAQKDEERRRQEGAAAVRALRLPDWYLRDRAEKHGSNSQDFAAWREANAAALQEKTSDEMSGMYIHTIEKELQKYRQEYKRRYNRTRETNWQSDHVFVKQKLFDDSLQRPSDSNRALPYTKHLVKS